MRGLYGDHEWGGDPLLRDAGRCREGREDRDAGGARHEREASSSAEGFIEEQAAQCGYCINGMIMTAAAFLDSEPHPTRAAIIAALNANLCRCGTHMRIVRAVERAARERA